MEENNKYVIHIISLVLGIISIVTSLFWYMTIPTGVIAIVLGVKSAKKFGSKLGKAGMITGIVGLSLFVFIYLLIIQMIILSNI